MRMQLDETRKHNNHTYIVPQCLIRRRTNGVVSLTTVIKIP